MQPELFDIFEDGVAVLAADHDHLAGGDGRDPGCAGDLVLVLQIPLHRLLLALDVGIHRIDDVLRPALCGLDDGHAVDADHHAGDGGGKVVVHTVLEAQQGHHHVGHLIGELVSLVFGAVAVLGGELAVFSLGEDHQILVVLVTAGVVEDLGIVLLCGRRGASGRAAAHQSQHQDTGHQTSNDTFHIQFYPFVRRVEFFGAQR